MWVVPTASALLQYVASVPGGYHPAESRYSYLDQTGTFRFEANVEYRFRIFKSIWGATFLDAGNVWLMRKG